MPPTGRGIAARARIIAEMDETGATRLVECWGEPPLIPRRTSTGVHFVAGTAGPLGGDVLSTRVRIEQGACLRIGSIAPTAIRPGHGDSPSRTDVTASVGPSAQLQWLPQPTVLLAGSRHRACCSIELAHGAELFWVEVLVLGDGGNPSGEIVARRSVDVAGLALSRQELRLGSGDPTVEGPSVYGSARVVGSFLAVHPEWTNPAPGNRLPRPSNAGCPPEPWEFDVPRKPPTRVGILPLEGAAVELVALGSSVRAVLDSWEQLARSFANRAPETSGVIESYVLATR